MCLYTKSLSLLGLEYNELSKLVPVTFMCIGNTCSYSVMYYYIFLSIPLSSFKYLRVGLMYIDSDLVVISGTVHWLFD